MSSFQITRLFVSAWKHSPNKNKTYKNKTLRSQHSFGQHPNRNVWQVRGDTPAWNASCPLRMKQMYGKVKVWASDNPSAREESRLVRENSAWSLVGSLMQREMLLQDILEYTHTYGLSLRIISGSRRLIGCTYPLFRIPMIKLTAFKKTRNTLPRDRSVSTLDAFARWGHF